VALNPGVAAALASAALFGISTPLAKVLVGSIPPLALAGLLYAGAGLGLSAWWLAQRLGSGDQQPREAPLRRADLPWFGGAVLFGGVLGPVLLMWGLARTSASSASLLLNLEGVFTALLAWFVFHENFDRRIFLGMLAIVAGGVLLTWEGRPAAGLPLGALAIAAACLSWALDNNFTGRVSASDPVQIAGLKGLVAAGVNLGLAFAGGWRLPEAWLVLAAGAVGLGGYGVSLALFVWALRHLGTARTGAYFSSAPFIGASTALVLLNEEPSPLFWLAALLMALGLWLHLTERHAHVHVHEPMAHSHRHVHDEHHRHEHDLAWDGREPHAHFHKHAPLVHSHPHYPDLHHRHRHSGSGETPDR